MELEAAVPTTSPSAWSRPDATVARSSQAEVGLGRGKPDLLRWRGYGPSVSGWQCPLIPPTGSSERMRRLFSLIAVGIILQAGHVGAQDLPRRTEAVPAVDLVARHPDRMDRRRWEDEIVYVIVVQKFFNGDPTNDV